MKYRRLHLIEKLRVQAAAVAALVAVYFWAYQALSRTDPQSPVIFLGGGAGNLVYFVAILMGLAVFAGAVTVGLRSSAAVLATLVGAAGLSLRSPIILPLLWNNQDALGTLMGRMILETMLLAALVLAAVLVAGWVRRRIISLNPAWAWQDPLATLTEEQRRKIKPKHMNELNGGYGTGAGLPGYLIYMLSVRGTRRVGGDHNIKAALLQGLYGLLLGTLAGFILLLLLMRSPDRAQILFAVAGSLFLAALLGYQVFPFRSASVALLLPVVLAVAMYALGALKAISGMHLSWLTVAPFACAVPLDWVTAGAAGAVAGYWVSSRIHEARYGELDETDQE
ncbi:MAG: hypothetical protein ABFD92_17105 [Planctomycetaceae bacterium]|nr:hypothetical protein [Planctomycetaceae bacterium]